MINHLWKKRSNKKGQQGWDMVIHHCSTLIGPHLIDAVQHPEMSEYLLKLIVRMWNCFPRPEQPRVCVNFLPWWVVPSPLQCETVTLPCSQVVQGMLFPSFLPCIPGQVRGGRRLWLGRASRECWEQDPDLLSLTLRLNLLLFSTRLIYPTSCLVRSTSRWIFYSGC